MADPNIMNTIINFLGPQNGKFADMFVRDGNKGYFQLHRLIVCPQSTKLMEICETSGLMVRLPELSSTERGEAGIYLHTLLTLANHSPRGFTTHSRKSTTAKYSARLSSSCIRKDTRTRTTPIM